MNDHSSRVAKISYIEYRKNRDLPTTSSDDTITDDLAPNKAVEVHRERLRQLEGELKRKFFIFRNPAQRALRVGEGLLVEEEFDFLRRLIRAEREAQFQEVVEKANAWLTAGKTTNRKNIHVWFANQMVDFEEKMADVEDRFCQFIDDFEARIKRTNNQYFRQKREEELKKKVDKYVEIVDHTTRDFERVLHEGINKYTGGSKLENDHDMDDFSSSSDIYFDDVE